MKTVVILAIVATIGIMFVSLGTSEVFATDFKDKNGYTPKWAKTQTTKDTISSCEIIIAASSSSDTQWCRDFTTYYNRENKSPTLPFFVDSNKYAPEWAKNPNQLETYVMCDLTKKIQREFTPTRIFLYCFEFEIHYEKINPNAEKDLEMYGISSTKAVTGSSKIYIVTKIQLMPVWGVASTWNGMITNVKCNDSNDVAISAGWKAPWGTFPSVLQPVGTNSYDFALVNIANAQSTGKATFYVTCMQVD